MFHPVHWVSRDAARAPSMTECSRRDAGESGRARDAPRATAHGTLFRLRHDTRSLILKWNYS